MLVKKQAGVDCMTIADSDRQDAARVSVRLTSADMRRLERIQEILQVRKGASVRVTQRTVIAEALEIAEKELTRRLPKKD